MSDINKNKYKTNNKINLYTENLVKFIIEQKDKIIPIGSIDKLDYIVGILFLTITNSYCKTNKINIHGYYTAYPLINLFNKIIKKLSNPIELSIIDSNYFITGVSNNIDYLNSRIDPTNIIKHKINNNYPKLLLEIIPILNLLCGYNKFHDIANNNDINENKENIKKIKYCNINCQNCTLNILSKYFYLLLQTAKFIGSGSYNDPNLIRLSEYLSNIFNELLKSKQIYNLSDDKTNYMEIYENYLNYKNKLIYSFIELNINSETLDEIINYIDNEIIQNLSIKIK